MELSLKRKVESNQQNQLVIKSHVEDYQILDIIFDFVEKFILCPNCDTPEGKMYLDNGSLKIYCPCCGNVSPLHVKDSKFSTFIQKNPP
jgi:translation initiation factor 5